MRSHTEPLPRTKPTNTKQQRSTSQSKLPCNNKLSGNKNQVPHNEFKKYNTNQDPLQRQYKRQMDDIKKFVLENTNCMTFNIAKAKLLSYNENPPKFYMIGQLIKNIANDNNICDILEELQESELWVAYDKEDQLGPYGLFHIASFIKTGLKKSTFERVVEMLYKNSCNPFDTNIRMCNGIHETAITGLFTEKNKIPQEEALERYKIYLDNFKSVNMVKILKGYLNKTIDKALDVAKFGLCVDPELIIKTIAGNFLQRTYLKVELGKFCDDIDKNVNFLIELLSEESLDFVKFTTNNNLTSDSLFTMFYKHMLDIINSVKNENSHWNNITFVRVLGSLAKNGRLVSECNDYIFKNDGQNETIEYLIHIVCQVGYTTQQIKDALFNFVKGNVKYEVKLENIFDINYTKNETCYVKVSNDVLGIYDPDRINPKKNTLIKKIQCGIITKDINEFALNFRDMFKAIKIAYDTYPDDSKSVVKQIIITLLENIKVNHSKDTIQSVVKLLVDNEFINFQSVEKVKSSIVVEIKSLDLDCSPTLCFSTLDTIMSSLKE
jgi:hypothetical protein